MSTPVRIQRKRTKGWRLPTNTVVVTRPSDYGNPFSPGRHYRRGDGGIPRLGISFTFTEAYEGHQDASYTTIKDNAEAVEWFRWYVSTWNPSLRAKVVRELRGKNLACWCPLDQPCHADVLLELANTEAQT